MNCEIKSKLPEIYKDFNLDDIVERSQEEIKNSLRERLILSGSTFDDSDIDELYNKAIRYWSRNYSNNVVDPKLKQYFSYKDNEGVDHFDLITYLKFKSYATEKIANAVIIFRNSVCLDEDTMDTSIKEMILSSREISGGFNPLSWGNVDKSQLSQKTSSELNIYFNSIISAHGNNFIENFSNGLIKYDHINGVYSRSDKKHHVAGWQRKDNRSAYDDSSGILKLLVESTPIVTTKPELIAEDINDELSELEVGDNHLTMSLFYSGFSDFIKEYYLSSNSGFDRFREAVKNPLNIIEDVKDYLSQRDIDTSNLPYTVLSSLWRKYFSVSESYTNGDKINLRIAYRDLNSYTITNDDVNYMMALINGGLKYVRQNYVYYTQQNIGSTDRLILETESKQIGGNTAAIFSLQIVDGFNTELANIKAWYKRSRSSTEIKKKFTELTGLTDTINDSLIKNIFETVSKLDDNKKLSTSDKAVWQYVNAYLSNNLTTVKSTVRRPDGTSMPTFKLRSGYSSFHINVANLKNREEDLSASDTILFKNPLLHTETVQKLYFKKYDESSMNVGEMNELEQLRLQFIDIRTSCDTSNPDILIQTITPSDKPNPGFQKYNGDLKFKFNKQTTSLNKMTTEDIRRLAIQDNSYVFEMQYSKAIGVFATLFDIELSGKPEIDIPAIDKALIKISKKSENSIEYELNKLAKAKGLDVFANYHYIIYKNPKTKKKELRFNRLLYGNTLDYDMWIDRLAIEYFSKMFDKLGIEYNQLDDEDGLLNYNITDFLKINSKSIKKLEKESGVSQDDFLKYHYLTQLLSQQYLWIQVGDSAAHKYKDTSFYSKDINDLSIFDFYNAKSESHSTMVKRMVALSATGHGAAKNVLNGLPEKLNYITISDEIVKLIDFNKEGDEEMNVWDGQVFAPITSLWMHDNSTIDYKVSGFVRKTIQPEVIGDCGYLRKEATLGISNSILLQNSGSLQLKKLLELSYSQASFENPGTNTLYDITKSYSDDFTNIEGYYKDENGEIQKVEILENIPDEYGNVTNNYLVVRTINGEEIEEEVQLNNLWDVWVLLGEEGSGEMTDSGFVFSEHSNYQLLKLINNIGIITNENGSVESQLDVEQFLKKRLIHYFPTESTNKSVQLPITPNKIARDGNVEYFIKQVPADNLMTQLDAEHEVDDSELSAPSQMISFMAQKRLVQPLTKDLYEALSKQIEKDAHYMKNGTKDDWVNIFGRGLVKAFEKNNVDILGLGNAILSEIKHEIDKNPTASLQDLGIYIPFSDDNIHSKLASDVIVYINKFIKHKFQGSADIMISTYDIVGVYEDEQGRIYNHTDYKFNPKIREKLNTSPNIPTSLSLVDVETPYIVYPKDTRDMCYKFDGNKLILVPVTGDNRTDALVIKNYNQFLELQKLSDNIEIDRPLNVPRNLKPKNVEVTVLLESKDEEGNVRLDENGNVIFYERTFNLRLLKHLYDIHTIEQLEGESNDDFKARKKEWENTLEQRITKANNVLYKAIEGAKNAFKNNLEYQEFVDIINEFGGFIEFDTDGRMISYEVKAVKDIKTTGAEIISTNRMMSKYNLPENATLDEIKSKGVRFFRENSKYNKPFKTIWTKQIGFSMPRSQNLSLKGKDGKHTHIFITDVEEEAFLNIEGIEKIDVPTDETGLYRVDENGEDLYEIEGMTFYNLNGEEIIVINPDYNPLYDFKSIINSSEFAFYNPSDIILPNEYEVELQKSQIKKFDRDTLDDIAKKQYHSFMMSLEYVCARIPSQSNQFATPCKIVSFINSPYNYIGVNVYLTYEQGSDYDIDKSYNVGYAFDESGIILPWSPFWNYANLNECLKMPLPNADIVYDIDGTNGTSKEFIDLTYYVENLDLSIRNNAIKIINIVNNRNVICTDPIKLRQIVDILNRHNSFIFRNKHHRNLCYDNKMVNSIHSSYDDLSTYGYARWMTTTRFISDYLGLSPKAGVKLQFGNNVDTITMNSNCSTAKAVVGITASGIKANYALEYAIGTEWFDEFKPELKSFDIIINQEKSGTQVREKISITNELTENINSDFSKVAIYLSTLCTQATDNAKNPVLYYINCDSSTAPAYLYLFLIGKTPQEAIKIMTTPLMDKIMKYCSGDFIKGRKSIRPSQLLSTKKPKPGSIEEEFYNSIEPGSDDHKNLAAYEMIFKGAEELTHLARTLSINQGIKTDYGQILLKENSLTKYIEQSLKPLKSDENFKPIMEELGLIQFNESINKEVIVFDRERFYSDSSYRWAVIGMMKHVSISFNPLYVLAVSPHFSTMDSLNPATIKILSNLSTKYRYIAEYAREERIISPYMEKSFQSKNLINTLKGIINNDMIAKTLGQTGFKYTAVVSENVHNLDFRMAYGIKEYVNTMNSIIIPILKRKYSDNPFVLAMVKTRKYMPDLNGDFDFFQLKYDLNAKENEDYMYSILMAFNEISSQMITKDDIMAYWDEVDEDSEYKTKFVSQFIEHSIADFMFMYNVLVFKNKLNGRSYSKLFSSEYLNSLYIRSYFKNIGIYDYKGDLSPWTHKQDFDSLYSPKSNNNESDEGFDDDSDAWRGDGDGDDDGPRYRRSVAQFPIKNSFINSLSQNLSEEDFKMNTILRLLESGDIIFTRC